FLDARPDIGIVGPRLLLPDGSPYMSATRFPTALTILLYETRLNRVIPRNRWLHSYRAGIEGGQPCAVDAVEGSCLLTRRAIWHQVGGFDGRYFYGCCCPMVHPICRRRDFRRPSRSCSTRRD